MNAFLARSPDKVVTENPIRARNAFNRDLGTIVHSNFFKRLSHKTQVFSLPYNDHVHTRLTHSVEAAQVGRHIARYFCSTVFKKLFTSDHETYHKLSAELEELTSAVCLAHDIGHSAFGHTGKVVIEEYCKDKNEAHIFDDNKQVVRILLNPIWFEKIQVSGPFVAAILKKKITETNCYDSERSELNVIMKKLELLDLRHPASIFMEAADDIAYLSGDVLDAIAIYSGKQSLENLSQFETLSQLMCVDHEGKELQESLKLSFDAALSEPSCDNIQEFSDKFLRVALNHVFRAIDHFSNTFFAEADHSLANLPLYLNNFIQSNAHTYKHKETNEEQTDPNLVYLKLADSSAGNSLFALKGQLYRNSIFPEQFIREQDNLARVVLTGILDKLYPLTRESDLSSSPVFKELPEEIRGYFLAAKDQGTLFPAILDVVSGMTDRYAISFWKETVGLTALDRIGIRLPNIKTEKKSA